MQRLLLVQGVVTQHLIVRSALCLSKLRIERHFTSCRTQRDQHVHLTDTCVPQHMLAGMAKDLLTVKQHNKPPLWTGHVQPKLDCWRVFADTHTGALYTKSGREHTAGSLSSTATLVCRATLTPSCAMSTGGTL